MSQFSHPAPVSTKIDVVILDPLIADSSLFLNRIITNDLLYTNVFAYCTPASLFRLARVCKAVHDAVKDYIQRAFNLNKLLSRFFIDPIAFRRMQQSTSTLISGSTALQFFDRSFYPDSDLDLYVPMKFRLYVGQWLMGVGYTFVPNSSQSAKFELAVIDPTVIITQGLGTYSGMVGVAAVFTFVKPSQTEAGKELKVQVIVSVRAPMEIILYYHSTVVMNVITYEKAYSLYPIPTFEERRSLICRSWGIKQEEGIEKYEDRGWEMLSRLPSGESLEKSSFLIGSRWIGDEDVWEIDLDMEGIPSTVRARSDSSKPLTHDPASVTSWKLHCGHFEGAVMVTNTLKSEYLFHQYISQDGGFLSSLEYHADKHKKGESVEGPQRYYDEEFIQMLQKSFSTVKDFI
ncbi:unnamed protein product [Somion occarium]|uniref:F-box domain-containing protein n=1 Tax=Somion occarium TaxID=3059160 RepID=A0ABP1CYZ5_9APHY